MIELETPRLLLRQFRAVDLDSYAAIMADPEVTQFLQGVLARADAWRQIAMILGHWQLLGYGMWAAIERSTDELVGRIGFLNPEGWPGFELGWMLGRRFWGRGLALEGAQAALAYAFGVLGQDHVISLIQPGNTRSIRLAERLGEQLKGSTTILGDKQVLIYGIEKPVSMVATS